MFGSALLRLLFPERCVLCGKVSSDGQAVCASCAEKITLCRDRHVCRVCSRPIPESAVLCRDCSVRPRSFTAAYCAAVYQGALRNSVLRYKFYRHPEYHCGYAQLLCDFLASREKLPRFDLVISAPLSKERLRERGYDQAELLARAVAKRLRLPFVRGCVVKTRHTPAQSTLSHRERENNLAGAFRVGKKDAVAGRTVLLVDDVFTTGATAEAISRALLRAGAKEVFVAALAVTPLE